MFPPQVNEIPPPKKKVNSMPSPLLLTTQETVLKLMNIVAWPVCKKQLENLVFRKRCDWSIFQSSKCPGLSVRTVSLNKTCRFAVVLAHERISVVILSLYDLQVIGWF